MILPCQELPDRLVVPPLGWMAHDPDTGAEIVGGGLDQAAQLWLAERRRNNLPVDRANLLADFETLICRRLASNPYATPCRPCGEPPEPGQVEREAAIFAPQRPEDEDLSHGMSFWSGPRAWAWLHRAALDGTLTRETLPLFKNRIGCSYCRGHFVRLLEQMPPDFSSREALFATAVAWHSEVSRSIGKPIWSVEQALARWS